MSCKLNSDNTDSLITHKLLLDILLTILIIVHAGRGAVGEGPPPTDDLDVTVNVNSVDLQSMLSGDLSPFNAYMSGLIQVSGDLRSAMQLGELVDRIKSQL